MNGVKQGRQKQSIYLHILFNIKIVNKLLGVNNARGWLNRGEIHCDNHDFLPPFFNVKSYGKPGGKSTAVKAVLNGKN